MIMPNLGCFSHERFLALLRNEFSFILRWSRRWIKPDWDWAFALWFPTTATNALLLLLHHLSSSSSSSSFSFKMVDAFLGFGMLDGLLQPLYCSLHFPVRHGIGCHHKLALPSLGLRMGISMFLKFAPLNTTTTPMWYGSVRFRNWNFKQTTMVVKTRCTAPASWHDFFNNTNKQNNTAMSCHAIPWHVLYVTHWTAHS